MESEGYQRHFTKLRRYEIPLPPLEIQEQIVAELDGYAGIISGAKQIAKNWKPRIEIDPEWEKVKIESITTLVRGSSPRPQGIHVTTVAPSHDLWFQMLLVMGCTQLPRLIF
ncbi:MAG: restriction endonuclease subunit S [Candidatus Nomurabacteria bacterium]|nr:MAG: restriction endonuclease subunit S [Candidatus Nomurabacteria bacterium]